MERSGATVPAVDDRQLKEAAGWVGPFLSVFLTTEQQVEQTAGHAELRWSSLRRRLAEEGAGEESLKVVDELVPGAHLEGSALGVVVAGDGSVLVDHHRQPLRRDVARWSAAPTLTPFVSWREELPPHIVVLIDRAGADLVAVTRARPPGREAPGGETWRISKPRGGGWAHWSFERRVEETWARNARAVAGQVEELVDRIEARLVVVAGDEHAVSILRGALPERIVALLRLTEGGRAVDGSGGETAAVVARLVASAAAEDTVAAIEKFREELGEAERAVEGAAPTLGALRSSQVDVLLAHDAMKGSAVAWFPAGDPTLCVSAESELDGVGGPDRGGLVEGRLVDVAVRAALCTGAAVRTVPLHGGPSEGLGALLRWS